jgi:cell division FtsZ-interacting protein ZapD
MLVEQWSNSVVPIVHADITTVEQAVEYVQKHIDQHKKSGYYKKHTTDGEVLRVTLDNGVYGTYIMAYVLHAKVTA